MASGQRCDRRLACAGFWQVYQHDREVCYSKSIGRAAQQLDAGGPAGCCSDGVRLGQGSNRCQGRL